MPTSGISTLSSSIIIVIALSIHLVFGCDDNNPIQPTLGKPAEIIPLAVGNQWWGTLLILDSSGAAIDTFKRVHQIIGDSVISNGFTVDSLTGDTTFHTETWYKWQTIYNDTGISSATVLFLFTNKKDGIHGQSSSLGPSLSYKFPAVVGDTFLTTFSFLTLGKLSVRSTDTVITIDQGTHSCYQYASDGRSILGASREFVAPNIGTVKWEVDSKIPGGTPYLREVYVLDSLLLK